MCYFAHNMRTQARTKAPARISDVLKRAILDSGQSLRSISIETGVQRTSILRFVHGELRLRLDLADALAAHFGLALVKQDR